MSKTSKPQNLKTWVLALALALALASHAQTHLEAIPGRLDALYIHGNCSVDILRSDRLALGYEHSFPYGESPFYQSGSRLIINDTAAHHYTLYYDRDTLPQLLLTLPGSQAKVQTQGVVIREMKDIDQFYASASQPVPDKVEQDTTPRIHPLDDLFPGRQARRQERQEHREADPFKLADRLHFSLLWGMADWGTRPLRPLSVMGFLDGPEAYQLQSSPLAFQFEASYAPLLTESVRLSVGLGYETTRYRFRAPLVVSGWNYLTTTPHTDYFWDPDSSAISNSFHPTSSRLVQNFVTLPITFAYRAPTGMEVSLTAIPGVLVELWNSGIHNEAETESGSRYHGIGGVGDIENPVKLDLRLALTYYNCGIFFQSAALPNLRPDDLDKGTFPVKVGLTFGF